MVCFCRCYDSWKWWLRCRRITKYETCPCLMGNTMKYNFIKFTREFSEALWPDLHFLPRVLRAWIGFVRNACKSIPCSESQQSCLSPGSSRDSLGIELAAQVSLTDSVRMAAGAKLLEGGLCMWGIESSVPGEVKPKNYKMYVCHFFSLALGRNRIRQGLGRRIS